MAVPSSTAPEWSDGTTMSGGAQTTASEPERNDERGTMRRRPKRTDEDGSDNNFSDEEGDNVKGDTV